MLAEDHLKRILHELYKVYISDAKKMLERWRKDLNNKNTNTLCPRNVGGFAMLLR